MDGRNRWRRVDGVLLLDKPGGVSSNAALQAVRRLYQAERAGHTGTLDPAATGLLPVCFGEATKFAAALLDGDKSYVGVIAFGVRTSTGDAEGEVIDRRDVQVSPQQLLAVLERFRGEILQTPPMHSALKVGGKPLYQYARQGQHLERAPRRVRIAAIDLSAFNGRHAEVSITCSKGTYVRALAEDIGTALGCGAHLSALRRTRVGPFQVESSMTVQQLQALPPDARLQRLLPPEALLDAYPAVSLEALSAHRFTQGQIVPCVCPQRGLVRVSGPGGLFLGIGECREAATLAPRRLVRPAQG